mmetsp:Transcript_60745/g.124006  ORF Transcript_60745/g.124006 Transcript_60745/m.124006 type:complete len:205 (+) Transcript_60745:24-638(+)
MCTCAGPITQSAALPSGGSPSRQSPPPLLGDVPQLPRLSSESRSARSSCALLQGNCGFGKAPPPRPGSGCAERASTVRPIWMEMLLPGSSKRGFFMATSVPNFELLSSRRNWPRWKRIVAWQREIDTSAMRTSLSWPRPSLRTFSAREITCRPRVACCWESRTMFSKTIKGGWVQGTSTNGARSLPQCTWLGYTALHSSQASGR